MTRSATGIELEADPAHFVARFVDFMKTSWVYPDSNQRIADAAADVIACARHRSTESAWTRIRIREDRFLVDHSRVPLTTPLQEWLRDVLSSVSLAGVELGPELTRDSLDAFSRKVKDCCDGEIAYPIDPDAEPPGLRPLDLVFAGGHYSADADRETSATSAAADVRRFLSSNERIQDRLQAVEHTVATLTAAQDSDAILDGIDLVDEIVELLPAEALSEPERIEDLVDQMLAGFQREVVRVGHDHMQLAVAHAALRVAKNFFRVRLAESELDDEQQEGRPAGRKSDRDVFDDVEELIAEFEALPSGADLSLDAACGEHDASLRREELTGLLLYLLGEGVRDETSRQLETCVPDNLTEPTERQLDIVEAAARGTGDQDARAAKIRGALISLGLAKLLLSRGLCTIDMMAAAFPDGFLDFVDSLSLASADVGRLRAVLARVGPQRLRSATIELAAVEGAITRPRLEKLLATGDGARVIGVALVRHGDPWIAERAARYLSELRLPAAERAALERVRPVTDLPQSYLEQLCSLRPGMTNKDVARESSRLLCAFIARTAGQAPAHEARLSAIRSLATAPSGDGDLLLQRLARTGRLSLSRTVRETRRVAAETLQKRRS